VQHILLACLAAATVAAGQQTELGRLAGGEKVVAVAEPAGGWSLAVEAGGKVFAKLANPLSLEFYNDGWPVAPLSSGYETFTAVAGGHTGKATVKTPAGVEFSVEDTWTVSGAELRLSRRLSVKGQGRAASSRL